MPKITPCLWFESQAEEAASFYVSIFKNSTILNVTPISAEFELDGKPFLAINGARNTPFTDATSFAVDCKTQREVDEYWAKLTDGGEEGQCGWLKDRFGVSWQVVPSNLAQMLTDPDRAKSKRTLDAMLKMRKLDIATLEKAHAGS